MDAPKLNALRQEIDAIDGDLHKLIRRRASLVGEISAAKPSGGLSLRPGREAEVRTQPTTVGVVPAPIEADTAPWWPLLASGAASLPNVVARLPFLVMPNARARGISALVLARIEPEESGDDCALISIEAQQGLSRDRLAGAVATAGLPAFSSAMDQMVGGVHHYLLELPGVIADGDPRLRALEAALALRRGRVAAI